MYGITQAMRDASRHVLTRTEEVKLHAAHMAGDHAAGQQLVNSFLPALWKMTYTSRMPSSYRFDMLGVAVQAFLENLYRFDPAKGYRMWSYMGLVVRHAVTAHVLANQAFFRVSAIDATALWNLNDEKRKIGASGRQLTGREARHMAALFGLTEHVIHGLDQDMSNMRPEQIRGDRSLQGHGIDDPERVGGHLDFEERHDHARLIELLRTAVVCLDARQREILIRRFKETPDTLQDLSDDMGVSRERIRQIEAVALGKLRHAMENPNEIAPAGSPRRKPRHEPRHETIGLDGNTSIRTVGLRSTRAKIKKPRTTRRQVTPTKRQDAVAVSRRASASS